MSTSDLLRQELQIMLSRRPAGALPAGLARQAGKQPLPASAPIAKTSSSGSARNQRTDNTKNLFIEGDNLEALKLPRSRTSAKSNSSTSTRPYKHG